MLEFILGMLIELGLLREDDKHHKRIREKEKSDGVHRRFQKYFLQPSTIIVVSILSIAIFGSFIFFSHQKISVHPIKTKEELSEMHLRAEKWHKKFGRYPTDINELIGNNPTRQNWKEDAWNRPYRYLLLNNAKKLQIISSGIDGQFETEDDIKLE